MMLLKHNIIIFHPETLGTIGHTSPKISMWKKSDYNLLFIDTEAFQSHNEFDSCVSHE